MTFWWHGSGFARSVFLCSFVVRFSLHKSVSFTEFIGVPRLHRPFFATLAGCPHPFALFFRRLPDVPRSGMRKIFRFSPSLPQRCACGPLPFAWSRAATDFPRPQCFTTSALLHSPSAMLQILIALFRHFLFCVFSKPLASFSSSPPEHNFSPVRNMKLAASNLLIHIDFLKSSLRRGLTNSKSKRNFCSE